MIIEQYWAGIARRLEIDSGVLNQLIPHNAEKGAQNELTLARMLSKLLPPSIGVGSGIVFDHENRMSKQMDIVLFDRSRQPQLLAQTNQVLFPVETVRGVIEVKTSLSGQDIRSDFPGKKQSITELKLVDGYTPPQVALFSYSFSGSDFMQGKELAALTSDQRPDLACVVDPGFVVARDGRAGFVPRIESVTENDGQITWAQPDEGHQSGSVLIDGLRYPVFMTDRYKGDKYIGDPGRALLIFCIDLIDAIGQSDETRWVKSYSSGTMHAVQDLGSHTAVLQTESDQ